MTQITEEHSPYGLWSKVKKSTHAVGYQGLLTALKLYYALEHPKLPRWARVEIMGALAYFINVIDLIPDVTPGVGFSDDLAVLTVACVTVASYIDSSVVDKAKKHTEQYIPAPSQESAE